MAELSDQGLRHKTDNLRARLASGAALDDLLVTAYATVREAAKRSLGMRCFDVQLMAGVALHQGQIVEIKTGEGKTLVATLPAYLNALTGKGVHIVTLNDYLARRDAEWMKPIYSALGLTVGRIQVGMPDVERRLAYGCDVTYGAHTEFGFDYLRDNMKFDLASMVQCGHPCAIVDEVDSILIDQARTPLIISGPAARPPKGEETERHRQTFATITLQNYFRMYAKLAGMTSTAESAAVELSEVYDLDVSVIPTHRPVCRIDHPDTIYRTVREKQGAVVEEIRACHERGQPVLVGTITSECSKLLSARLERESIPHMVLDGENHERDAAILAQAGRKGAVTVATYMAGRGTEIMLGGNPTALARAEIDPRKEPERHRQTVARQRELCARERDEVMAVGGLHVLGTERHESRRVDRQLREHAGCRGDPGSSSFHISLDDHLMRIFGADADRLRNLTDGMEKGEVIEHPTVDRAIERAQQQVEDRYSFIRRHLLRYDGVLNEQREALYTFRREILEGKASRDLVRDISGERLESKIELDLSHGDTLRDQIWRSLQAKYRTKQAAFGEPPRTLERGIMLQALDDAWRDHLRSLDELKESIDLRGSDQGAPLEEYQRRSFELFEEMTSSFEDSILRDLYRVVPADS